MAGHRAAGTLNLMNTGTGGNRAVEFTSSDKCDSPVLPKLQSQMPQGEQIGTLTGESAYDTRRCPAAILDRGAAVVIHIRKNGRL